VLEYTHQRGIFHRDVKPPNILIDQNKKQLKLIDWGLAEFYIADKPYNLRVSTKYYKGPELLSNDRLYDYSLDIWSTGVMFAGIVSQL